MRLGLIKRLGESAGFDFPVHFHMLRHGCGYALANAGHDTRAIQDWLGHRSIQRTVRYTELAPTPVFGEVYLFCTSAVIMTASECS
jgi:site-specific recombinase XerD